MQHLHVCQMGAMWRLYMHVTCKIHFCDNSQKMLLEYELHTVCVSLEQTETSCINNTLTLCAFFSQQCMWMLKKTPALSVPTKICVHMKPKCFFYIWIFCANEWEDCVASRLKIIIIVMLIAYWPVLLNRSLLKKTCMLNVWVE